MSMNSEFGGYIAGAVPPEGSRARVTEIEKVLLEYPVSRRLQSLSSSSGVPLVRHHRTYARNFTMNDHRLAATAFLIFSFFVVLLFHSESSTFRRVS
jgi:hypothetical protein